MRTPKTAKASSLPLQVSLSILVWLCILVVLLLSACVGQEQELDQAQEPSENQPTEPSASGLQLHGPVHHRLGLAREPMLVEHPSGALFVSGYGFQVAELSHPRQVPHLWTSTDGGQNWNPVDVGSADDGALGNSDVDLAVGPNGTLYFASMGYDRSTFRGTHIAIGTSHDIGVTWSWTMLSETEFDDRPWVVVTPNGTAHVVWNDGGGISYARSEDRGATWQEQEKIHPAGGSSHFAAGPEGELAVRISPMSASANRFDEGVDLIKVSLDDGATWSERPIPGNPVWAAKPEDLAMHPRWAEPLAWDASGSLFHLWSEGRDVFLARSKDAGASWQSWTIAQHADRFFFPYLTSKPGAAGQLAATSFAGRDDTLTAFVAHIFVPEDGVPKITSAPLTLEILNQIQTEEGSATVKDTGGEYFPVAFLSSGSLGVVTTFQPIEGEAGFSWWTADSPE